MFSDQQMPPAMVDFPSPTLSSFKHQSNGLKSDTGRIRSSMIRSIGIPDTFPSIDRPFLGQGLSASMEKSSVIRLRKHRKRSGASRSRPSTTASDGGAGLELNLLRSEMPPPMAPLDREEDPRAQFVRELSRWKPFASDASNSIGTGFVFRTGFGSGLEKDSSSSRHCSQSLSAQNSGSANFVTSQSNVPVNVLSDRGVFVFGKSGKDEGHLGNNACLRSDNNSIKNLNLSKNVDEESERLDSSFSALGIGQKQNTYSSNASSSTYDYGLFSEHSDRTRKIDQDNYAEAMYDLDQKSSFTSASKLPENLRKLKIETYENDDNGKMDSSVFAFSSAVNMSNHASKSSSSESFDGSFSKLPDKMEKLNLQSYADEVYGDSESNGLKKNAQVSQTFSVPDKGLLNKQNLPCSCDQKQTHGNHGVFVFCCDERKSADSGKQSYFNIDEISISKLPDEIRNMKLSCSGKEEDDSKKSKSWHDDTFVFGSDVTQNTNFGNSSHFTLDETSISKLPDELRNMNLNNITSPSGKEDNSSKAAPLQAPNLFELGTKPASSNSHPSFIFDTFHGGLDRTRMEFMSQKQDASLTTKENLFNDTHRNSIFGMKKGDSKGARVKKNKGKIRHSIPIQADRLNQYVFVDTGHGDNHQGQDSTGGYSPMDYSPYQEIFGSNQCSQTASSLCDESTHFDSKCTLNEDRKSVFDNSKAGGLFSEIEHFDTNERLLENKEKDCSFSCISACELLKGSYEAKNKIIELKSQPEHFSLESEINHSSFEGDNGFTINSFLQDATQPSFLFATRTSVQVPESSSFKHSFRRKRRVKGGLETHLMAPLTSPPSSVSNFLNSNAPFGLIEHKDRDDGERIENVNKAKSYQDFAEESCEKWRICGNQAYSDGNLTKAEDYYSRGIDLFSLEKSSKCCSRALMLCYSNRAATRMTFGRLREALNDCKMAALIDPSFLRAQVRAGNIHLSLGESIDARLHFENVLKLDSELKSDQKILLEAVDGLEKVEKLNDLMDQCSVLLTKRTLDDASKALEIISDALFIAPHSENLLEMKAESMIKLQKFDETIQLCKKTLEFAEKNVAVDSPIKNLDCLGSRESSLARVWRWLIMAKSYFYLGKIEEANDLLQKHEREKPAIDKNPESSTSFPATIRELLRLKNAGNEAYQARRYSEAVELYTSVLALNTESRPFTAICFCNRAAAYQSLGQITDAIADCSLAISLNSGYRKAISRRATLHELIRDYGQAASDISKLASLLEMRPEEKNEDSGALSKSSSISVDLNHVRIRLCEVEEEARKGRTLDMYMILGVEKLCSAADLRKAYRKAALRHHPDKAGQFLVRGENYDDNEWRRVAEEVHSDADRLFKMIGEAYAILVDPNKRLQYDTEEELSAMKKGYGSYNASNSHRTPSSSYSSSHYERSSGRSHRPSYGSAYRHYSEH